jgi:hypothetical protein
MTASCYSQRIHIARSVLLAGLLAACVDLSAQTPAPPEDIRPPKPLVEIPQPKKAPIGLWLGIGGGVLLLAASAVWWRHRLRRQRLKSPPEIALASLAELDVSRERISAEAFANLAAQVVRQYIADRFGLAAPRRTTEEFFQDLAKQDGPPSLGECDPLHRFLKACDLAKFAGSNLDSTQREELLVAAREFIRSTAAPSKIQPGKP